MNIGNIFRWGIELTPEIPADELAGLARASEREGFDGVFVSSHYNNRDPGVVLGQIATATETVRLGHGVANPYDIHPARLAAQVATIDELSDGRALLGIGAGDRSTLGKLGVDRERPLRRVRETIAVLRRLWAGDQVSHDGTFDVASAELSFPTERRPILVGAQGPHMLRMAAEHADGILVNAAHPRDYAWAADQISIGREDRDETRGPLTTAAFASVSIAEDGETARAAARPPVAYIVGGAAGPILQRHGIDTDQAATIERLLGAGEHERAYDHVTPTMLDAFCIAGGPETVVKRIERLFTYVDAFVAASPLGPDRQQAISLLGNLRGALAGQEVQTR